MASPVSRGRPRAGLMTRRSTHGKRMNIMTSIDLNCDLGEGFGAWEMGNDAAMIDLATSVNIACGFHAGDADIMRHTVELAKARGVSVGAHPGYRDLHGFGRRPVPGLKASRDREPRRLSDRRAAGDRDRGRPQGDPCQGAWRALQRRLRRRHDRQGDRKWHQGGRSQSDLRGAGQFAAGAGRRGRQPADGARSVRRPRL